MPINSINNSRTYITNVCYTTRIASTSQGGYEYGKVCYPEEKPILDWEVSPTAITKEWNASQPIPSAEILTVQFPQVYLLTVYKKHKGFRNYARIATNEYVELIAPNGQELDNLIGEKHNLQLRYNNFNKLPESESVQVKVTFGVIATEEKGGKVTEIDLPTERKEVVITLRRITNATPQPKPNETPVLNMVLNTATKELTGDTTIQFYNPTEPGGRTNRKIHLQNGGEKELRGKTENVSIGLFEINSIHNVPTDTLNFSLSKEYLTTGKIAGLDIDFSKPQVVSTAQNYYAYYRSLTIIRYWERKSFTINLTVINDTTAFYVDKKLFNYVLKTDKKERAEGVITIKNPNHLTFTINNSDFLEVTELKGNGEAEVVVKFRSQSSELMNVGENRGWLKVTSSAGSEQIVNVNITVQTNIDFSTKTVYFCLDKELTRIRQTSSESEFVSVALTMEFNGYGRTFNTVQTYDYVFFDGEASIDIGQEVQDLFKDIVPTLEIDTQKLLAPKEVFKATKVSAVITETNFRGTIFKTHTLTDLYYLPGKKPKAYPYLTQSRLRSTYTDSLISVSALTQEVRSRSLGQIGSNLIDLSAIKDPIGVANFSFLRSTANATYGATAIISKETLSLEPKPEPNGTPISALFQNQNFCPDWFSFAGEYEALVSYEHTISDDVLKSEDYKAQVKTKHTYKLNTGWLFPEEIEVLWELVKSPVCYLRIKGEWLKVIPITQKPLSFDNTRNLHSFVVEFQLSSND
jgi:hypothetical protein